MSKAYSKKEVWATYTYSIYEFLYDILIPCICPFCYMTVLYKTFLSMNFIYISTCVNEQVSYSWQFREAGTSPPPPPSQEQYSSHTVEFHVNHMSTFCNSFLLYRFYIWILYICECLKVFILTMWRDSWGAFHWRWQRFWQTTHSQTEYL